MKKISILALTAFIGLGAMAQETVLKDAEKAMKSGASLDEVVNIITPAFTDPVTANQAQTYFIPGKTAFSIYDNIIGKEAINGKVTDEQKQLKPVLVLKGYEYLIKALPLDSVVEVDKKGNEKIKTKYSKDIINIIGGHYNDYNNAAIAFYNDGNYADAYKSWDIYTTLPLNPVFEKTIKQFVQPDSIIREIVYNQGLAAWQMEDYASSLKQFKRAIAMGYNEKNIYDYALAVASLGENQAEVLSLAKEADELYGNEDSKYISVIINDFITKKDYSQAVATIDQAIAKNPSNAQYYVIKGVIFEQENSGDAIGQYEKAVSVDPENAMAQSYYGRLLAQQAIEVYNNAPNDGPEFTKVFVEEFKPMMEKAVPVLEKAYQLNNDDIDSLRMLEQAYYLLNDEANLARIQNLLKF